MSEEILKLKGRMRDWSFRALNELQLTLFERWIEGVLTDKEFTAQMIDFIERKRREGATF